MKMKIYYISVDKLTEEQRMLVQRKFFELGFEWPVFGQMMLSNLTNISTFSNTDLEGNFSKTLRGIRDGFVKEKATHTFEEFMNIDKEQKAHIYADLMMEYAQDAKTSRKPWLNWQYRQGGANWKNFGCNPSWSTDVEYRRKPTTININGFEVPEPLIKITTEHVWVVDFEEESLVYAHSSYNEITRTKLKMGLCHSTREAAELHAKALLSFTKQG